jgi:rod shape-determining protein MreC
MVVSYNVKQKKSFIDSSNAISGFLYETFSSVSDYFSLNEINSQLSAENAALRDSLVYSYYSMDKTIDTNVVRQFVHISCKVINNSTNRKYNFLTLNKGSLHGLKPDMAVISPSGVAGIVIGVSPHYSVAISLLNENFKLSAKLKKTGQFGTVVWKDHSADKALFIDIPSHVKLTAGDTIITSGFSAIFPEGILIGTIASFEKKTSESFFEIDVDLSTDFSNLSSVYVIINKFRDEQIKLEEGKINE